MNPKISIIIPSYNKGLYISQTLSSICRQNYRNYEVIIQDGGSTDNTVEILKKYEKNFPGKIYWESKKDGGQLFAIQKGLEKSTGDIITYINADDYYLKNAFKIVCEYYCKKPSSYWFVGKSLVVNKRNIEIAKLSSIFKNALLKFNLYNLLLVVNYISQPSVFLSKKIIDEFKGFTGTDKFVTEYDLWLKIGKRQMPVVIEKNLSCFRMSDNNITSLNFRTLLFEDEKIVKKYTKNVIILMLHRLLNIIRMYYIKII